jgi:hypothetical protein
MKLLRLGQFVEAIKQAPHEIYYGQLTVAERVALARAPKTFLAKQGLPVRARHKVTVVKQYESARPTSRSAGYLIATFTRDVILLACVSCDVADQEWSTHA